MKLTDKICPICNSQEVYFKSSEEHYSKDYGCNVYECNRCKAMTTTHGKTKHPKSKLSDKETRELRKQLHDKMFTMIKNKVIMKYTLKKQLSNCINKEVDSFDINYLTKEELKICLSSIENISPSDKIEFSSEWHLLNYTLKTLRNKCPDCLLSGIDKATTNVWKKQNKLMKNFINDLKSLKLKDNTLDGVKDFRKQVKKLTKKYEV